MSLPTAEPFHSDIASIVHPVEVNLLNGSISICDRRGKIGPGRRDAEHSAASRFEAAWPEAGASVKNLGSRRLSCGVLYTGDEIASARLTRITSGREHHANGRLDLPLKRLPRVSFHRQP